MVIKGLDDLYETAFDVESSEDVPEAIICLIKCCLQINETVE